MRKLAPILVTLSILHLPAQAADYQCHKHILLGRLGLNDAQAGKIDVLLETLNRDLSASASPLLDNTLTSEERTALHNKISEIRAGMTERCHQKIQKILTEQQRKKYKLAKKLHAELLERRQAILAEMRAISARDDLSKREKKKLRGEIHKRLRALQPMCFKKLDEQVGTFPGRGKGAR